MKASLNAGTRGVLQNSGEAPMHQLVDADLAKS
jgi:hypothetical protein